MCIRLDETAFDQVRDDRATRGRRWSLQTLLVAVTAAMVAGARSLADTERITHLLSRTARRWLAIKTTTQSGATLLPSRRSRQRQSATTIPNASRRSSGSRRDQRAV